MSAQYVRTYYGVPAKRGMRIAIQGKPATIVGFSGAHLRLRVDGEKHIVNAHPTWEITYPETEGTKK
jgi:hypothetical protein